MTPTDHLPAVLTALLDHLAVERVAHEWAAIQAEQKRHICPDDGCLILAGETCPACRVRTARDRFEPCFGCGTLADPDAPCGVCAGMRGAA